MGLCFGRWGGVCVACVGTRAVGVCSWLTGSGGNGFARARPNAGSAAKKVSANDI